MRSSPTPSTKANGADPAVRRVVFNEETEPSTALAAEVDAEGVSANPSSEAADGDVFEHLDQLATPASKPTAETDDDGDIFDHLERLRIDPSATTVRPKKQLLYVPVRKPRPGIMFRVRNDPSYSISVQTYHDDLEREFSLVMPDTEELIRKFIRPKTIVTCITRQGALFLWPVPVVDANARGGGMAWNLTAREAMEEAKKQWISIVADQENGCYEIIPATALIPEPDWPPYTFNQLLRLACKNRIISGGENHPKVQELLGLA